MVRSLSQCSLGSQDDAEAIAPVVKQDEVPLPPPPPPLQQQQQQQQRTCKTVFSSALWPRYCCAKEQFLRLEGAVTTSKKLDVSCVVCGVSVCVCVIYE